MELPSPTNMQATLEMRCLTPTKLFQTREALPKEQWFNQLCLTLYFAFRTLTHKQFLPNKIHQANLERMAWLKSQKFLKPKPPSFWDLHRVDQATGVQKWPDSVLGFHQNLWTTESSWLHNFLGNCKAAIVYVEIDCTTDLIRVAFPAHDKFLPFQLLNLLSSLSFTNLRSLDLFLDKNRGTPRIAF